MDGPGPRRSLGGVMQAGRDTTTQPPRSLGGVIYAGRDLAGLAAPR
jgi:hypothetical protein